MDEKEVKLRYDIILAGWRFLKDNAKILDTDDYWDSVVKQAEAIVKQFDNHRFAHEMVYIVLSELNNTATGKKEIVTEEEYGKVVEKQLELWKRFNERIQKEDT
jgi:sulfatase maturation enzyme AslB (radical SAM superfamily)